MKINFNASYQNVASWLEQGSSLITSKNSGADFSKKLAQFLPKSAQDAEKIAENTDADIPKAIEVDSPKAMFNINKLNFKQAKLNFEPVTEEELPAPKVIESVKTPSLVSVKRLYDVEKPKVETREQLISQAKDYITKSGLKNGVDPALGMSVAKAESDFNPKAVSTDGHASKGLFQLLDSTADTLIKRNEFDFEFEPFNPEQNVDLGMNYLRYLHDVFAKKTEITDNITSYPAKDPESLEKLAVAAFNAGEGRVASAQKRAQAQGRNPADYASVELFLPSSTRDYVSKVISKKHVFIN